MSDFKPASILQLNSFMASDDPQKGFDAAFVFLLIKSPNELKSWTFKVTVDSFSMLHDLDSLMAGWKILKPEDPILAEIWEECKGLELPIPIEKRGDDYLWFMFKKMVEMYVGIINA